MIEPMIESTFTCCHFGADWSITSKAFASAKDAEKHGLFHMPTAGVLGFAVIEETENFWGLHPEHSILPPQRSISQDKFGNFHVDLNVKPLQLV